MNGLAALGSELRRELGSRSLEYARRRGLAPVLSRGDPLQLEALTGERLECILAVPPRHLGSFV